MTTKKYTLGNTYCVCGKKPCICLPYTIFENEKPYAQISHEAKGKYIAAALNAFQKKNSLEGKAKSFDEKDIKLNVSLNDLD